MDKYEVGQVWKTRSGWTARIVAIINSSTPILCVHTPGIDFMETEEALLHWPNGQMIEDELTGWDLVEKIGKE